MKRPIIRLAVLALASLPLAAQAQLLQLNPQGYLEADGLNVMVFNNPYHSFFYDEKRSGIDIIHHGELTATNGAVRLQPTPEQWDLVPETVTHHIDPATRTIDVVTTYKDYDFSQEVKVTPRGNGFVIEVLLDRPVPTALEGKAGFNLEFIPTAYWAHSYLIDRQPRYFPRYPASATVMRPTSERVRQVLGYTTYDDRGRGEYIEPLPLAKGHSLVLAPEDSLHRVKIESRDSIMLYDGRHLAQNGWFVARSLLPVGKVGKVLEWYVEPATTPGWRRQPNIGFSQVGYEPTQHKQVVIELDSRDQPLSSLTLWHIDGEGHRQLAMTVPVNHWGTFKRYRYATADFSAVTTPGIYCLQYGSITTNAFPIAKGVYDEVAHPSMDVWFPVQMDHMTVREAYRIWHGEPFKDDCVQAPVNTRHFDNYEQGPETLSPYKSLEHIPGFNAGGWFDAGDFDIETPSHDATLLNLVATWETFTPQRDQTFIDQTTHYTEIHRPDGKPDLLQQIEHGVLPIVAQVEQIGHPCRGITLPTLYSYHHLGDASTETDNAVGTGDERWCFTTHNLFTDYFTAAALAAVSRAMKTFNPSLADRCLQAAVKVWNDNRDSTSHGMSTQAALELWKATGDNTYRKVFERNIFKALGQPGDRMLAVALQACGTMDEKYRKRLEPYVKKAVQQWDSLLTINPYGVDGIGQSWGGNGSVVSQGMTAWLAHHYYPTLVDREQVLRTANFLFGCHPDHNKSFVAGVGIRTKNVTYGNTRADYTFIAGGVAPGLLALKPDYFENKDDWPFYWGENECTIGLTSQYIFLAHALRDLMK